MRGLFIAFIATALHLAPIGASCPAAVPGASELSSESPDALDRLVGYARIGRLSFDYAFTSGSSTKVCGAGHALIQGEAFLVRGNGMEIYCDGETVMNLDRESREVVLESSGCGNYLNPAVLVASVDKTFRRKSVQESSYSGKQAVKYVLEPVEQSDIRSVTIYVSRSGSAIYFASFTTRNNGTTDFILSDFKILSAGSAADFRLDLKALGPDYIVTDLR